MKRILLTFLLAIACTSIWAQAPQSMNYQAVVRDDDGKPLIDKLIGVKISLLTKSTSSSALYEEAHAEKTNMYGVLNLRIGEGDRIKGNFSSIDWSSSSYYLKFSIDTTGGDSYQEVVTTQLLSVPYALYAETAGNALNVPNQPDPQPNRDFIISADHAKIFTGTNPLMEDECFFRCQVIYLDQEDQEVALQVQGLPASVMIESDSTESGNYGKYYDFTISDFPNLDMTYDLNLVFENKYGINKQFPFRYKHNKDEKINEFNDLNDLITDYKNKFTDLSYSFDRNFIEKGRDDYYLIFYKTYEADNDTILKYWNAGHELSQHADKLIKLNLNSYNKERLKIKAEAHYIKSLTDVYLAVWFGKMADKDNFEKTKVSTLEQANGNLGFILANYADGSLSDKDLLIKTKLLNSKINLLLGDWDHILSIELDEPNLILDFHKKIARWKKDGTSGIDEESLMDEYINNLSDNEANLYLNILEATASYLNFDPSINHKIILPIPSEIVNNTSIQQNTGY